MPVLNRFYFIFWILFGLNFIPPPVSAHNGEIALAYPVNHISIDGNLSDWAGIKKYPIALSPSEVKPQQEADLSAYFQMGYSLKEGALYVALEVNDDDYVRDTSRLVRWNSQDAAELYFDVRHLSEGSAVTSYLYSETYKHINNSIWDPVSKLAGWDKVEVALKRFEKKTVYEWKFILGKALIPGSTIGFDIHVFDKDQDGFGWNSWGKGDAKFRNPNSLGDIILMKEHEPVGEISGQVQWNKKPGDKVSARVRLTSVASASLWVSADMDSLGNFKAMIPKGNYTISFADQFVPTNEKIYQIKADSSCRIAVRTNQKNKALVIKASVAEVPDLIPEKGILHSFDNQSPRKIDQFIRMYQKYYKIPGISLALIKDGKVVYHQVYGVKNNITKVPVDGNTLFEAASVTKPVFSYAVQRLAERGVIDLDKPLYLYMPYEDIAYDDRYKLITARHVLSHRTGFPNWRDGKLVINFTPGTQYSYSGEGMQYLQAVIEKITGKGIEEVLKEEVLDPVGLYHTYFSKNDTLAELVCTGHFDNIPSTDGLPEHPGMAYSMHTEANVFSRFMLQLLNQQGLSAATYANMLSERSLYTYKEGEVRPKYKVYMGESLEVRDSPYGQAFGHGGNNGDFRCQFEVYKELKMGYALFTNSNTSYPLLEKMKYFLVEGKQ